jgi:hypothetical protein
MQKTCVNEKSVSANFVFRFVSPRPLLRNGEKNKMKGPAPTARSMDLRRQEGEKFKLLASFDHDGDTHSQLGTHHKRFLLTSQGGGGPQLSPYLTFRRSDLHFQRGNYRHRPLKPARV